MESAKTAICFDRATLAVAQSFVTQDDLCRTKWPFSQQFHSSNRPNGTESKKKPHQRCTPYIMPHNATFIYICYNSYRHPKCFTSPYVPGSRSEGVKGCNFLLCYCFHFRWGRRFPPNLKITPYFTFQSSWKHLIWEVFFGKWLP